MHSWVHSDGDGGIKVKMDRREEARGFNELMTVLTTRCLLAAADEIINKRMNK